MFLDYELKFLKGVIKLVDQHLDEVDRESRNASDPDMMGHLDRANHAFGLGFIACQNYVDTVVERAGLSKTEALDQAPLHRCGLSFAALTNAAANYWKHSVTWGKKLSPQQQQTKETLEALQVRLEEYALSNILARIVDPHSTRFGSLLPFLVHWRDTILSLEKSS